MDIDFSVNRELDATGLVCPEPIMLLHQAVKLLAYNDVLKVLATDPSTVRDIPKFCAFLGYNLLNSTEKEGVYLYYIQKLHSVGS